MSISTDVPSFAKNIVNSAKGVSFDIESGKKLINVTVSNDKVSSKPAVVRKGTTYYSGKGVTHCDLYMYAMDSKQRKIKLNHTSKLNRLMVYKLDKADKKNKLVSFPSVLYALKIYTSYKISKGSTIDMLDQNYGRGTTIDDVSAGNKSLRFHESQHSGFSLRFLNSNAVPDINLTQGMLKVDVQKNVLSFFSDFNSFQRKFNFHMEYDVDCVGTIPDFCSKLETRNPD